MGINIEQTLQERDARYGDFTDHANATQSIMDAIMSMPNWHTLTPVKRQALTGIADKIGRIGTGDPEYKDNWHDIQGYAKLAEDRCVDDVPQLPLQPESGIRQVMLNQNGPSGLEERGVM